MEIKNKYNPALKYRWLTPLYDPLLRWVMKEEGFKWQLIRQAQIVPGQRVLDLGCGTATLTIMLKQARPEADVVGLDGDPEVLAIGREKVAKAGVEVRLDEGMAYSLIALPIRSFTEPAGLNASTFASTVAEHAPATTRLSLTNGVCPMVCKMVSL